MTESRAVRPIDTNVHAAWRLDVASRAARHYVLTGLAVAPGHLAHRLGLLSTAPPAAALAAAEELLTDVVLLAQTHTDAGISDFRETLEQRRPAIDPPIT